MLYPRQQKTLQIHSSSFSLFWRVSSLSLNAVSNLNFVNLYVNTKWSKGRVQRLFALFACLNKENCDHRERTDIWKKYEHLNPEIEPKNLFTLIWGTQCISKSIHIYQTVIYPPLEGSWPDPFLSLIENHLKWLTSRSEYKQVNDMEPPFSSYEGNI